jgi:exonuclease VII small subunit
MKNAAQKQFEEAVRALNAAAEGLEYALNYQTDAEDSAARWAKVRALQAQAQLHILHSISHDLEAIEDAIHQST